MDFKTYFKHLENKYVDFSIFCLNALQFFSHPFLSIKKAKAKGFISDYFNLVHDGNLNKLFKFNLDKKKIIARSRGLILLKKANNMEGGYFLIYSLLTLRIFIQLENPKLCIEEIQTHS